jgi:hypothetical protein
MIAKVLVVRRHHRGRFRERDNRVMSRAIFSATCMPPLCHRATVAANAALSPEGGVDVRASATSGKRR